MPTLNVRIDEHTAKRLDRLSKKNRRTKSSYIKEMLELYLEDFEDGISALERINDKNAKYLNLDEVKGKIL
jgi:predicted DNA-binding protein